MGELRQRAEKKAGRNQTKQFDALPVGEAEVLLQELRAHKIELEMQNEELRRAQKELEASRERYFNLYDLAPVGYLSLSQQGLILETNLTAATLLGMERGALAGQPLKRFILFADEAIFYENINRVFEAGKPQVFELRLVNQDGTYFWARLEVTAAKETDGIPVCRAVMSNITERKLAEEALQHAYKETKQQVAFRTQDLQEALVNLQRANRALTMLKECDEAIAGACSEPKLLQSICRILVEAGGAKMAWIGFPNQDEEKTVRLVAGAGDVSEYLKTVKITWADNTYGRGPTGTAIRTGKAKVCRNIAKDSDVAPWRAQQLQRGCFSSVALPLIGESRCFGAVSIYSPQVNAFNDEEVKLLMQLAGDLAFAIVSLRARAERELLQEELRKSDDRYQSLSENMQEGFSYCRVLFENDQPSDFLFLAVNNSFERLTGIKNAVGKTIIELIPNIREYIPGVFEIYGRVALTGQPERFEHYIATSRTWLRAAAYGPERGSFVVIFDDITEKRRLENEILEVSESEQKRLGQELHDDLGQQLTGLSMLSSLLAKCLKNEGNPQAAQAEDLSRMLQHTILGARNLAKGLYPIELERGGLFLALSDLTERITIQTRINCRLSLDKTFVLPGDKAIHLFRIVQEAINNAIKHGKARNILVECILAGGIRTLRITDDGVGFKQPEPGKAGMGLHLFEYRARIIGAKIAVANGDAGGCQVTCSLGR